MARNGDAIKVCVLGRMLEHRTYKAAESGMRIALGSEMAFGKSAMSQSKYPSMMSRPLQLFDEIQA
jgi:hypothetical protein